MSPLVFVLNVGLRCGAWRDGSRQHRPDMGEVLAMLA
jgi:hypothetical protein